MINKLIKTVKVIAGLFVILFVFGAGTCGEEEGPTVSHRGEPKPASYASKERVSKFIYGFELADWLLTANDFKQFLKVGKKIWMPNLTEEKAIDINNYYATNKAPIDACMKKFTARINRVSTQYLGNIKIEKSIISRLPPPHIYCGKKR